MADKFVNINDVRKLRRLFKEKRWDDNPNEESVFDSFCDLLDNLIDEQKELIFELTQNYLWITSDEYTGRFNSLLDKIDDKVLKECKTIYLFPILKKIDENTIKSGSHCVYLFRGLFSLNKKYRNININIISKFEDLNKKVFKDDGTEIIFFVDDYIGSGETFEEAWSEALKNPTIQKQFTYVFSLVIQNEAMDLINDIYGLVPLHTEARGKGITDKYDTHIRNDKIRIMKDIENIINPPNCRFGYKGSEALVTMSRTPDNTFPVFWSKYRIRGIEFIPPFPRD